LIAHVEKGYADVCRKTNFFPDHTLQGRTQALQQQRMRCGTATVQKEKGVKMLAASVGGGTGPAMVVGLVHGASPIYRRSVSSFLPLFVFCFWFPLMILASLEGPLCCCRYKASAARPVQQEGVDVAQQRQEPPRDGEEGLDGEFNVFGGIRTQRPAPPTCDCFGG